MATFTIVQDIVGQTFTGTLKQLVAGPNYYVLDGARTNVPKGPAAAFRLIIDPTQQFWVSPGSTISAPQKANASQYALFYAQLVDAMFTGR